MRVNYEQPFVPKDAQAFNELTQAYIARDLLGRLQSPDGIVRAVALAEQERLALLSYGDEPWTKDPNA